MSSKAYNLGIVDMFFGVINEHPFLDYEQECFTNLYLPIVGGVAETIYRVLNQLIDPISNESPYYSHKQLFLKCGDLSEMPFLEARGKLEAVGLLETYTKDQSFIYLLKPVKNYGAFFKDDILSCALLGTLGMDETSRIHKEHLIHRYDPISMKFKDITKSFDDVFEFSNHSNPFGMNTFEGENSDVQVINKDFNFEGLQVLLDSSDILNKSTLSSPLFLEMMSRYNFLYKLTIEELKEAVLKSSDINKQIDYDLLSLNCKKLYGEKNKGTGIHLNKVAKPSEQMKDSLENYLTSASPYDVVLQKYGSKLTPNEVQMFEDLQYKEKTPLGVLNVCIIFVMDNKKGEIPSYNYFLKILNSWKRDNILTIKDALNKINEPRGGKNTYSKKPEVKSPEWYESYKKNRFDNEVDDKNQQKMSPEEAKEFADFFKPKENEDE